MDKTVRIGVDATDAKNVQNSMRQSAEQLARDMIRSSRQYSSSSKEVLRDIEEQIRAIEKRNKLDAEFRRSQLDALRERGGISESQFATRKAQIGTEYRQDTMQTRLIRELIETVKQTSKEEIREDRRNIEKTIHESKTVGRLGVAGDELEALKRTVQKGILGDIGTQESQQNLGFALSRGLSGASSLGSSFAAGNAMGMFGGLRALMMNPAALAVGAPLALLGGGAAAGMSSTEQLRSYMMAMQTNASNVLGARVGYGGVFQPIGMGTEEGMNFYGNVARATGGKRLSNDAMLALASITRSRDISPELLNQTVGFQRYSGSGGVTSVVTDFERALERLYPADFKRKLIQLPEMMSVYNSLAQQMVNTIGSVDQQRMSSFVAGIQGGFGVEGQNLQRYASGMMRGFGKSGNNFIRMMQFNALRRVNPNISYQESIEALEDPTSNVDYMRVMERQMRGLGLRQYSSWFEGIGLSSTEARRAFESNDFDKAFEIMGQGVEKTKPTEKEVMEKYYSEAETFQNDIRVKLDQLTDVLKTEGIKVAQFLDLTMSGEFKEALRDMPASMQMMISPAFYFANKALRK